ncbi:MAG: TolC family protein [Prevotellaceae bacterium]|nr:TolC family protein [Prevotellaceae bacterium]
MKNFLVLCASALCLVLPLEAQTLSLDSCRAMAMRNNKQLGIARAKQQVAMNVRKSARTKYLPHIDLAGGWMLSSREVSLLNNDQKNILSNLGTTAAGSIDVSGVSDLLTSMVMKGLLSPQEAQKYGQMAQGATQQLANFGNSLGENIKDAFRTDTRSIIVGSVVVNQPVFMGGAITAANRMADINEQMAAIQIDASEQNVLYDIDKAYWLVVSLRQKQRLAESYLKLVTKLDEDVNKMIKEGVATRADGLKVDVKVNEAEMTKTQVDNGLSLARMLLCQLCGIPVSNNITLVDESRDDVTVVTNRYNKSLAMENRPELKLLDNAVALSEQSTKIARATMLPQVAVTGGYMISNPNLFNGYEKKFGGMWNVGIMVRVPVFDWGDATYKVRASKIATTMARMTLDEAREMIDLQVNQCDYQLKEANKKLVTAEKNIKRAEENLRCANLGFSEGVMDATEVMAAQTAWLQAKTQKIDAQIDVCLGEAAMKKAIGMR